MDNGKKIFLIEFQMLSMILLRSNYLNDESYGLKFIIIGTYLIIKVIIF